jgi:hypothetical protein
MQSVLVAGSPPADNSQDVQTEASPKNTNNGPSTTGKDASAKSALARSLTGTLAFYFKRPVRLFRFARSLG